MLNKATTCVVHLTTVAGSMQASARLARFLADTLGVALVDDVHSMRKFLNGTGITPRTAPLRQLTVLFVNGPIAFCGYRDPMGAEMLPYVDRVFWVQQDYTITMPPNQAYSRPTKAETPFRAEFHKIPHVHLWSTCQDVLQRRQQKLVPGYELDEYVNWNALTYAPVLADPPSFPKLFYYGALRAGRTRTLCRFFDGPHGDNVVISLSNMNVRTIGGWRDVVGPYPHLLGPCKGAERPRKALNGNKWGEQLLVDTLCGYQHALYIADDTSNTAFHSLANRFYEVLSTPYTVLWLDAAGEATYRAAGLKHYDRYMVDPLGLAGVLLCKPKALHKLAEDQRKLWLATDPFKALQAQVKQLARSM